VLIDTHCHLDFLENPERDGGISGVLERSRAAGIRGIVLPAVTPAHFDRVRDLAHAHEDVFYALGIHPIYVEQMNDKDLDAVQNALDRSRHDPKLVAVGEIGLDHYLPDLDREKMDTFFTAQLRMAARLNLPVVLHVRKAQDQVLKFLRQSKVTQGIAHAFNGSLQQAQAYAQQGLVMGFGGTMTYPRALQIRRLACQLPLASIVLETDAPDLAPSWKASEETNEPAEILPIAACLASLRGEAIEDIIEQTGRNAVRALPGLSLIQAA